VIRVDTTNLGLFQTRSLLMIDANTDLTNGPNPVSVSPVSAIPSPSIDTAWHSLR